MTPKRGDIFSCALDPTHGSEQRGTGPVIVVSNDAFNEALALATVVPITTFRRRSGRVYPSEAFLPQGAGSLRVDSIALCHHVRTVARTRLRKRLGALDPDAIGAVDEALAIHLAIQMSR